MASANFYLLLRVLLQMHQGLTGRTHVARVNCVSQKYVSRCHHHGAQLYQETALLSPPTCPKLLLRRGYSQSPAHGAQLYLVHLLIQHLKPLHFSYVLIKKKHHNVCFIFQNTSLLFMSSFSSNVNYVTVRTSWIPTSSCNCEDKSDVDLLRAFCSWNKLQYPLNTFHKQ